MVMNRLNRYDSHNLFDLPITINKREIATRCACMWQEFNIERTIHKKLSVISQMFIRNISKISLVKSPCPNQERKSKGRNKWFCSRIWYVIFKIFVCHYSTECKIKLIHWGKQDWFGISGEKPKTAFRAFFTDMDIPELRILVSSEFSLSWSFPASCFRVYFNLIMFATHI